MTFATLDDLAFAAERGRLNDVNVPTLKLSELGPIIELSHLAETTTLPRAGDACWAKLDRFESLISTLSSQRKIWLSPGGGGLGFFRTRSSDEADANDWIAFCFACQKAAIASGFDKTVSAQLAAAMKELRSNIFEHSQAVDTGIVAFDGTAGRLSLVVADHGVGVLRSLATLPAYCELTDHGEALRLALTDGVSRFGTEASRGYGFRDLFKGLANLNGYLRFRSGDHALIMDGQSPSLISHRLAQKTAINGFVISIECLAGYR